MEISKTTVGIGFQRAAEEVAGAKGGLYPQTSGAEIAGREGEKTPGGQQDSESEKALTLISPGNRARISVLSRDRVLSSFVASDTRSSQLLKRLQRVAESASPLLIRGERGTGRHLAAWVVHHLSTRADQPFLTLDCRRIPREVLESELFGVERSSTAIPGQLELAAGGTLVIDEITALDSVAQAKLLRAIEDKQVEPVAGSRPIPVRARIIVLTSIGIENALARRAFREDLYYRLNALSILVPPLRDRPADIAHLTERFLDAFSEIQRRPRITCTPEAMAALEQYSFPGNVSELQGIVERAAASGGDEITLEDLPPHVRGSDDVMLQAQVSLEEIEHAHIAKVLQFTRGKKSRAAKLLGISRKTLLEKRKKYGLG